MDGKKSQRGARLRLRFRSAAVPRGGARFQLAGGCAQLFRNFTEKNRAAAFRFRRDLIFEKMTQPLQLFVNTFAELFKFVHERGPLCCGNPCGSKLPARAQKRKRGRENRPPKRDCGDSGIIGMRLAGRKEQNGPSQRVAVAYRQNKKPATRNVWQQGSAAP